MVEEEDSGWAVPTDVDRKELSAVLKSSGPGVLAEPGRDLAGKSVHNDSGDSAGRKLVFVGRVEEGGLEEGGAPILRPPPQNDPPEGALEGGQDIKFVQPRQIMHRLAGAGDQAKNKNHQQSGDEGDKRVSNSLFDTIKRKKEGQTVCLTDFARGNMNKVMGLKVTKRRIKTTSKAGRMNSSRLRFKRRGRTAD